MKRQQSGFTLVEIAIVLVIIGLLLGGILKGQELINSARVKNLANDFRTIPTYIYAFQDKYRALPGDDINIVTHVTGSTLATTPGAPAARGNGVIEGAWNSGTQTDESYLFWQHVRLANIASGPTAVADATYVPRNTVGGAIGISSANTNNIQVAGMTGTYQICSTGILGNFVIQLDTQMDDGQPCTGSMRAVAVGAAMGATAVRTVGFAACGTSTDIDPAASYTVCMTF